MHRRRRLADLHTFAEALRYSSNGPAATAKSRRLPSGPKRSPRRVLPYGPFSSESRLRRQWPHNSETAPRRRRITVRPAHGWHRPSITKRRADLFRTKPRRESLAEAFQGVI